MVTSQVMLHDMDGTCHMLRKDDRVYLLHEQTHVITRTANLTEEKGPMQIEAR
jgi:hypothetical protein